MPLRGVVLTLRHTQASQRGLRVDLQSHAADGVGQRRGMAQLGLRRQVRFLGEQSLAAPAPRAGLDLAQAVRFGDRQHFIGINTTSMHVGGGERDLGQPVETANRQIALCVAAGLFERGL